MITNYKLVLHRVFKISIIIKGIDGVLDVITGLFLLFSASNFILKIIPFLVRKELVEDPQDIIANYFLAVSQNILPSTKLFIIIYLIIHGLIKIGLALALSVKSFQVYKIAQIVLITFICYQIYRFSHTHSSILLITTLMDIVIAFLIQGEAKNLSRVERAEKEQ